MIIKLLFFLIHFILAGSRFPKNSATILSTFNENILAGNVNALQLLINSNSKLIKSPAAKQYRNNGFISAVQEGRASVVEFLLKNANIDAGANNNEAIRTASANGNLDIVRMLLSRSEVNPGAMDNDALIKSTRNGHTEVVRLLLTHPNVESSARNYQAIFTAISRNRADLVKIIINNERDIPTQIGFQILERAANFRNFDLVRYLLNHRTLRNAMYTVFYVDNLLPIKAVVKAGYIFDQDFLDMILQYHRSRGNNDIAEYLESLKKVPKLPEKPLIAMTEQCAICLSNENLLEGYMTSCQHHFHVECLQEWISRHNSCPMCRSSII